MAAHSSRNPTVCHRYNGSIVTTFLCHEYTLSERPFYLYEDRAHPPAFVVAMTATSADRSPVLYIYSGQIARDSLVSAIYNSLL